MMSDFQPCTPVACSRPDENIFYALSKIDNSRVFYIYLKNNPENIQGDTLLKYCLEEYCLENDFMT